MGTEGRGGEGGEGGPCSKVLGGIDAPGSAICLHYTIAVVFGHIVPKIIDWLHKFVTC